MEKNEKNSQHFSGRINNLQRKFAELEPGIEDSNIKRALSLLNGMIQEIMRNPAAEIKENAFSLKDVSTMYRNAPKMEGAAISKPLTSGTKAPDFSLKDADGKIINLSDFNSSTVMLVFYPLDWSPGCSQQLDIYQQEYDEFQKRGINILGISVDSIYSHGAWASVRGLSFPLLSDFNPKGETAKKYGVYREQDGFSERALFLIGKDGMIRHSYMSPFLNHIPDIYELFDKIDSSGILETV